MEGEREGESGQRGERGLTAVCLHPGAKFRKYVGHSAHVTNVRFTHDQHHVISVGGADNAIFEWRFLSERGEEEEGEGQGVPLSGGAGWLYMHALQTHIHVHHVLTNAYNNTHTHTAVDSDSELSDSDMSDVPSLDSDLEQEQEKSYERLVLV